MRAKIRNDRTPSRRTVPSLPGMPDAVARHFLTVDPGITGTGWAAWSVAEWKDRVPPVEVGVIIPDNAPCNKWHDQGRKIYHRLAAIYARYNCSGVYVEWPNFRGGAVGQSVAASGDLGKLYYAASLCLALGLIPGQGGFGEPVPVVQWKGQLPKAVVAERIVKRLGQNVCDQLGIDDHAWDAVGIGMYLKGWMQ